MSDARKTLDTFTIENLPDLDVVTLGALELFVEEPVTTQLPQFSRPLVVGSAGALAAGRIMYAHTNAVFADETTVAETIASGVDVDGAVLISASGSKHAVEIGALLEEQPFRSVLLTNNGDAPAAAHFAEENVFVFPKNREPYTNNTSTYMGMLLAKSGEDPAAILSHITTVVAEVFDTDLAQYDSYTFIAPKEYASVSALIRIKFEEMFEPKVHGRAYNEEEIKHAKTVVEGENELFISLGVDNKHYGLPAHRVFVPLPDAHGPVTLLAIAYYIVGKIQGSHPPYFKDSLVEYCKRASAIFGKEIKPIVE